MHLGGSRRSGRTAPDPAAAWAFRSGPFAACSSSTTAPTARSTANTAAARSQRAGGPATACRVHPSGGRGRGQRSGRERRLMATFLQLPIRSVIQISDFEMRQRLVTVTEQRSSLLIRPKTHISHHWGIRKEEFIKSVLLFDDVGQDFWEETNNGWRDILNEDLIFWSCYSE